MYRGERRCAKKQSAGPYLSRLKLQYLIRVYEYAGRLFGDSLLESALRLVPQTAQRSMVLETMDYGRARGIDVGRFQTSINCGLDSWTDVVEDLVRTNSLKRPIYKRLLQNLRAVLKKA